MWTRGPSRGGGEREPRAPSCWLPSPLCRESRRSSSRNYGSYSDRSSNPADRLAADPSRPATGTSEAGRAERTATGERDARGRRRPRTPRSPGPPAPCRRWS
jgi:hypothetical protein